MQSITKSHVSPQVKYSRESIDSIGLPILKKKKESIPVRNNKAALLRRTTTIML
jgi:hypothetical protein